MRTYELNDEEGRLCAFEIENLALDRRGVTALVRRLPGARVIRTPRILSWWREETFCEFEIGKVRFTAGEPFGDNSRYWIGPQEPGAFEETEMVRSAFATYLSQPWISVSRRVALALSAGGFVLFAFSGNPFAFALFFTGGFALLLLWVSASLGLLPLAGTRSHANE